MTLEQTLKRLFAVVTTLGSGVLGDYLYIRVVRDENKVRQK
jgi:hypothetical protein